MKQMKENLKNHPTPIEELEEIIAGAGDDVKKLFGPGLTLFTGPYSGNSSYADKKAALERLIRGN
jgi:hypothetical protein